MIAQPKLDLAEALLNQHKPATAGAWLTQARLGAASRLGAMGAPVKRDEYWRYTNPTELVADHALTAPLNDGQNSVFDAVDALNLVFVDGVFSADESDDLALEGVSIETLSDAGAHDIHWAKELYGVLEEKGQDPVDRPLAALNSATAEQGLVIHVTATPSKPISISYVHRDDRSDAMIHHVIKLDAGASMTLLETGAGAARFNSVMEVDVADTAAFHHIRSQGRTEDRKLVTHIFGRLGAESVLRSFTLAVNGKLTRNEAVFEFTGDDAQATVAGAAAGDGRNFHHDDTVFVTHDAVNCESRQVFKKVLRNGATGVFQGKILVQPDAQKTDGYQISQGLLLDEDSQFLAKPELEIYADDVACSHGSTCGAIDANALFYMTSRGIPKAEAQDLLVLAFLGEAIDEIEDDALADIIRERLAQDMVLRTA